MKTNPDEFIKFNNLIKDHNPFYMFLPGNSKIRKTKFKSMSFKNALSMMKRGYNIAIVANENSPIIILDIDHPEHMTQYKHTLKCVSGSRRGYHLFYITNDSKCRVNYNGPSGEFQANMKYVVCPGSYVNNEINDGTYFIEDFRSPATITFDELPEAFQRPKDKFVGVCTQRKESPLNELKIEDIFGISNGKIQNPFHESESKNNTTISNGVLHCWRHDVFHTPISSLAVLSGQIECSDGFPHNGDNKLRKKINLDQLFVWAIINGYLKEK